MIEDANASLMAGDIARARRLLVERVRAAPSDRDARAVLFQLFCLLGLWDKAATALAAFVAIAPDATVFGAVYAGVIAAEREREAAFAGRAPFRALVPSPPWFDGVLDALSLEAKGEGALAAQRRAAAFDVAGDTPGRMDDTAFTVLADGDERFGPCLELIMDGVYGMVPFEAVRRLVFHGAPQTARDLVWAPVRVTFRHDEAVRTGFVPVRYPGVGELSEPSLVLARETRWIETDDGPQIGLGQRMFFTDQDIAAPLLDCRAIWFD